MFKVSVIIPVYNAAAYLVESVESAVNLEEVGEVILIEDKSPDNALEICLKLAEENKKVKVLQHPNGENRGAGASRNLGIINAKYEFISFLDADDWYLKNRFHASKKILMNSSDIDGVYGATAFYSEYQKEIIKERLTALRKIVAPEDLLFNLLMTAPGNFHTNAITVRKKLFDKIGLFSTTLKLHQDTHMWLRMAYAGRLVPESLNEPIAVRRMHEDNRIANKSIESRQQFFKETYEWFKNKNDVDKRALKIIANRYFFSYSSSNKLNSLKLFTKEILSQPKLLLKLI
ncbi:glycosyltransferase family 2 protein [Pontibacter chinhatensis]|uniref:Glycosyl transferase family 2 n=1 Tax=Pontibacter chinhatensis TaxID=1436961 RepID=A0A1I2QZL4_9BACT|nr:glycosyltransferase family 2 protein [Pontibacter chinhatensis]SFG33183.1 Glycosyl transferase family 2 [Pontibacter chinhatensis]